MSSIRAATALHGGEKEEENCRSKGPVWLPQLLFPRAQSGARMKNISVQNTPGS